MNVPNAALIELKSRGPGAPLEEKLELLIFGRVFSAEEWSKEWSAGELGELWEHRDWEKLRQIADLAKAHSRMREKADKEEAEKIPGEVNLKEWNLTKALLPDIYTEAQARKVRDDELRKLSISELIWEFAPGASPEVTESRIRFTQEALWEILSILHLCRLGAHPLHAGLLCLSRRAVYDRCDLERLASQISSNNARVHRSKMVEHQREMRPGEVMVEYQFEGTPDLKAGFRRFEQYTVPNSLTSNDASKALKENELPHDPAHIRRAAKDLGVTLAKGSRGPKASKAAQKGRLRKSKRKPFPQK